MTPARVCSVLSQEDTSQKEQHIEPGPDVRRAEPWGYKSKDDDTWCRNRTSTILSQRDTGQKERHNDPGPDVRRAEPWGYTSKGGNSTQEKQFHARRTVSRNTSNSAKGVRSHERYRDAVHH